MSAEIAKWIPWVPALAAVLCGLCCVKPKLRTLAAPICIGSIAIAFILSLMAGTAVGPEQGAQVIHAFRWIHVGSFEANFSYLLDPLSELMLYVVTGIGTLVAWYAASYMKGDPGFARFFAAVSLFIFAMTTLVLADNLVLLYLGWEGVGLCSYLLIGFYNQKPSAVAAAKKAFIVNRIGDLGFALGIFLTFVVFGTIDIPTIVAEARQMESASAAAQLIPYLLMLGAFGKSAQLPLYVWLPDAMEGPTPVSALIHAATMVTAGVYMIVRLLPVFEASPYALPVVATVGGVTALFAATIALCQYDLKKIWAYSTISQLGYMFLGVGALSAVGGVFHLFTHAFFKALLFLTAGSVMHALAGQLDLRKISGLKRKMPVTRWLMLIGCLALAGVPGTAGFFSKDMILAGTFEHGGLWFTVLGVMGLFTAFLTAFYTFRLYFRVWEGPTHYEMGEEHHGEEPEADHVHAEAEAGEQPTHAPDSAAHHGDTDHGHHDAHEMPLIGANLPLIVLAVGALIVGWWPFEPWVAHSVEAVTASGAAGHGAEHAAHGAEHAAHHTVLGMDLHVFMMILSGAISLLGIGLAWYYHGLNRPAADRFAAYYPTPVRILANKYYVDEALDQVVVKPLRALGYVFWVIDDMIIHGFVRLVGFVPRLLGLAIQPAQRGVLQGYGLGMAAGVALIVVLVWMSL